MMGPGNDETVLELDCIRRVQANRRSPTLHPTREASMISVQVRQKYRFDVIEAVAEADDELFEVRSSLRRGPTTVDHQQTSICFQHVNVYMIDAVAGQREFEPVHTGHRLLQARR